MICRQAAMRWKKILAFPGDYLVRNLRHPQSKDLSHLKPFRKILPIQLLLLMSFADVPQVTRNAAK
jgi:hypothetical protein